MEGDYDYTLELDGIGMLVLIMSLINKLEEKSSLKVFMPIGNDSDDEMKHLVARQTSLYFLLQVFKSSYNEKVILHNEKQEL